MNDSTPSPEQASPDALIAQASLYDPESGMFGVPGSQLYNLADLITRLADALQAATPPSAELNSSDELSETHESAPDVKFSAPPTAVPAGWVMPDNIDEHPKRYDFTRDAIERVLFRRALEKRLDGYTLETSLEIADAIAAVPPPPSGESPLSCADAMELARDMLHDEWLQTGDSETLAAHYVVADALAIFVSEPFTSPPSATPSREEIAALIRERVHVGHDHVPNADDVADSILALFARGAG